MKIIKLTTEPFISLAKTQTAKNTYLSFLANSINGITILAFNIICSRTFGPSLYGVFSLTITLYVVLYDIFGLGIDQGMIRFIAFYLAKKNFSKANAFAKFGFLFRFFFGALVSIVGFSLSEFIAQNIFNLPQLAIPLKIAFIGEFGIGLLGWAIRYFMAQQNFLKVAIFESIKGILRLVLLFLMFLLAKIDIFKATAIYTIIPLLVFLLAFLTVSKKFLKAKITNKTIFKLIHFSKWLFVWAATATFHSRVDLLMLARLKGSFAVGIYSVASGLMVGFIWLISAFSNVLAPKLSQISSQEQFVVILKKSFMAIFGFLFLIATAFILAKPIIVILFSPIYEKSIPIFQILCIGIAFFALNTPFMSSLYAIGKSKSIAILSIFQLFLLVTINLFTIPTFDVIGPAITFISVNLITTALTIYLVYMKFKKGTLYSR